MQYKGKVAPMNFVLKRSKKILKGSRRTSISTDNRQCFPLNHVTLFYPVDWKSTICYKY